MSSNGAEANGTKKGTAVSMRLRPQEQDMFDELAVAYGLFGATNAVRSAGRVLVAMRLDFGTFVTLLEQYEKEHPDCVPCKFYATEEASDE